MGSARAPSEAGSEYSKGGTKKSSKIPRNFAAAEDAKVDKKEQGALPRERTIESVEAEEPRAKGAKGQGKAAAKGKGGPQAGKGGKGLCRRSPRLPSPHQRGLLRALQKVA